MGITKKIFSFLTSAEKKKLFFISILIITVSLFDIAGIASIFPFIALISNPQLIETNIFLQFIFQKSSILGIVSVKQFLILIGTAVFVIIVISLMLRALSFYLISRYTLMHEYTLSERFISNYLEKTYLWFLSKNSTELGKNILSDVNKFVNEILMQLLNLFSNILISIFILILLIYVDYKIAFISFSSFLTIYLIFFYSYKKKLSVIGHERLQANSSRFSIVSEVFNSIKEIKVMSLEKTYINRFASVAKIYAKNQSLALAIGYIPRFFLEAVTFGGLILLLVILYYQGNDLYSILPIISIYAFAGYRLIPSLQNIYYSLTSIRFSISLIDLLYSEISNFKILNNVKIIKRFKPIKKNITLNNISFKYPNSKKYALKDVNITIPAFKKIALVGRSGSGKTTVLDIIAGLLELNQGSLIVDGNTINKSNIKSWQKNIGYMTQNVHLTDDTVASNIAFGEDKSTLNFQAVKRGAKIANIHDFVLNELPNGYETIIGEKGIRLSGGQRQRIGIARVFYREPSIVLLDEATNALDYATEKIIINSLNNFNRKLTLIIVTHRLETIKNCNIIFLFNKGKFIASGSFDNLKKNKLFREMTISK